jgi:hypothetical protein
MALSRLVQQGTCEKVYQPTKANTFSQYPY